MSGEPKERAEPAAGDAPPLPPPAGDGAPAAGDDSSAGDAPPPTGVAARVLRLGRLGSHVSASYLKGKITGLFRSRAARDEALSDRHRRNALRIADALSELKGAAMKVGQLLSIQEDAVPEEFRDALARLQTSAKPMVFPFLRDVVETELGSKLDRLFRSFEKKPLASASLGQVHRAELLDGTSVAVKVQYPGIEESVESDLKAVAALVRAGRAFGEAYDMSEALAEVRERLAEELDYEIEASNVERFRAILEGHPFVVVPRVHRDRSSAHVLTLDLLPGLHLDAFAEANAGDPELLSLAAERLGRLFWHLEMDHGVLHADPHPGNYLFLPDARVGLVDFGCVKVFSPAFHRTYRRLVAAIVARDEPLILQCCTGIGFLKPEDYGEPRARDYIRWGYLTAEPLMEDRVWDGDWGEYIARIHSEGREIARRIGVWLPRDLVYLHRVVFGLLCFWKRLDARRNWHRLVGEFTAGEPRPDRYRAGAS